jgi:hypothetical protein
MEALQFQRLDGGGGEPAEAAPGVVVILGPVGQAEARQVKRYSVHAEPSELADHLAVEERGAPHAVNAEHGGTGAFLAEEALDAVCGERTSGIVVLGEYVARRTAAHLDSGLGDCAHLGTSVGCSCSMWPGASRLTWVSSSRYGLPFACAGRPANRCAAPMNSEPAVMSMAATYGRRDGARRPVSSGQRIWRWRSISPPRSRRSDRHSMPRAKALRHSK